MPVHIDRMASEVTLLDGDMPLTEAQIEKLLRMLIERLEARDRAHLKSSEATKIHNNSPRTKNPGF